MTTVSIESVGLCAHYSSPGDWAFDFALDLARRRAAQLNVFHFLSDPYDPSDHSAVGLTPQERERLIIERERVLRFTYEDRLGEWVKVGFRLCEDREWTELHRCLLSREFQVLVLPWPSPKPTFGGVPLQTFAAAFVCPVVLIGPGSPTEVRLNSPAALIADQLGLGHTHWSMVDTPADLPGPAALAHALRT